MKFAVTILAACCALLATPLSAKEFRHYFGMQWVVSPREAPASEQWLNEGDTITEASFLTEDLFEIDAPVVSDGRVILAAGAQLATATSAKSIRCSLSRGEDDTLSETRRICLLDTDEDGLFDHYFDVGLGQGGGDVQFTGCIPNDPAAIAPVTMREVDPASQRDPMSMRMLLRKVFERRVRRGQDPDEARLATQFEVGGSMGRNDRIWNYYRICSPSGACRIPLNMPVFVRKEGVGFTITDFGEDRALVRLLSDFRPHRYYDMSRGNRPPAFYCPGTLFVETDEDTF